MAPGRTGDEVLARIRHAMADEGLEGLIYCHVRFVSRLMFVKFYNTDVCTTNVDELCLK